MLTVCVFSLCVTSLSLFRLSFSSCLLLLILFPLSFFRKLPWLSRQSDRLLTDRSLVRSQAEASFLLFPPFLFLFPSFLSTPSFIPSLSLSFPLFFLIFTFPLLSIWKASVAQSAERTAVNR